METLTDFNEIAKQIKKVVKTACGFPPRTAIKTIVYRGLVYGGLRLEIAIPFDSDGATDVINVVRKFLQDNTCYSQIHASRGMNGELVIMVKNNYERVSV